MTKFSFHENRGLHLYAARDFKEALFEFSLAYSINNNAGSAQNAYLCALELDAANEALYWKLKENSHSKDKELSLSELNKLLSNSSQDFLLANESNIIKALFGDLRILQVINTLVYLGKEDIAKNLNDLIEGRKQEKYFPVSNGEINELFAAYASESQPFGGSVLYQSCPRIGLPGVRTTSRRLDAYGLHEFSSPDKYVLDLGANIGNLSCEYAYLNKHVDAVEYAPSLVSVGEKLKSIYHINNISFHTGRIEEFLTTSKNKYDIVLACAITQWLSISVDTFFTSLLKICNKGAYIIFESNNLDTFDNSFDSTVSEIINKHAMELVEMRSGYEDLFYRRAVAILKVI